MEYLTALFIWISTAESVQQAKPWCDQYADIVEHPQFSWSQCKGPCAEALKAAAPKLETLCH